MKDFLLIFLEFFTDVAFGIHQGLFAYPVSRHLVLMNIAHLKIVTKDIIAIYLQGRDMGLGDLSL